VRELAAICGEQDLWLHADGAYGAPAAVLPEAPEDLRSLRLADSVALDPHKWLYCPLEAACVLTRDAAALRDAFAFYPAYYKLDDADEAGINYYQLGVQNSRGFRALKVWMALRAAGREGFVKSIRDDIDLAGRLFDRVDAHGEFVAHSVHLSIATFRYVPRDLKADTSAEDYLNELNRALLGEIQGGGDMYLTNAIVAGRYLLRACIVNFRTSRQDIDELPEAIAAVGRRLDRQLRGEGAA
jgi:aromatic-L-amino-acid decarboxylase